MRDQALDSILCQWFAWQQNYSPAKGFNSRALVCGDFRVSRQYDDVNGALDVEIENDTMKTVEFEVGELADLHRWTIQWLARELSRPHLPSVFMNPRLPQDKQARDELVLISRVALTERLMRAGVM